jgi:hypothetical protein
MKFVGRLLPLILIYQGITVCGKLLQNLRYFKVRRFSGESAASPYLCLLLLHNALSKTKVKEARVPTLLSPHCWGPRPQGLHLSKGET